MAAERSLARVFHFHRGENRLFHFFGAGEGEGPFQWQPRKCAKKASFGEGGLLLSFHGQSQGEGFKAPGVKAS